MQKYQTKKRFGQHFLHDQSVIQRLIHAINPTPDLHLLEIGPGLGALTFPLLKHVEHIHVVDIDRDIIAHLTELNEPRLTIHEIDALKLNLADLNIQSTPLRIVGNLPYNISTPLIFHLLESSEMIQDMHFMLQKEVVDRMSAEPNTKLYGRLSVMVQYHCETETLFNVGPSAFNPPPKVDSAIVRLRPWQKKPFPATDVKHLRQVVTAAFSLRRKTLRNSLKNTCSVTDIKAAGIDPTARAETLAVEDFVRLSNYLLTQT